ncbi:MAG TPA: hypothetical protein VK165_01970 [Azonexus sp.]|nr:hypothetical protein [Azonexus sp.]
MGILEKSDQIFLSRASSINDIIIQASLEEVSIDATEVTRHPVEIGAQIADHAYDKPSKVIIRCAWGPSGSISLALGNSNKLTGDVKKINNGEVLGDDVPAVVYSQLLALREKHEPIGITTQKRQYNNMLITGMSVTTDFRTRSILSIEVVFEQVFIVQTAVTTVPAKKESHANPSKTLPTVNAGYKMCRPVVAPSGGGAVDPKNW